jgi:hypothetical protein
LSLHRILSRRNVATAEFAEWEDFQRRPGIQIESFEAIDGWPHYLMYSLNPEGQTAQFLDSEVPLAGAREAPFLYDWQRAHAQHVLEVPFARLPELGNATGVSPTFILSTGRSGSTLLGGLLRALGQSVASEPDSFTSFARALRSHTGAWSEPLKELILRACLENVRSVWGARPYLKLRGLCNILATRLATVSPDAKFVFVLRERRAWAMSHLRAFGGSLETMIDVLLQTISAYDSLSALGYRPTLIWYEDLCARPLEMLQILPHLHLAPNASEQIRSVMAEDSQANTSLSRSKLRDLSVAPRLLADFDAAWQRVRPTALLEHHGLEPLL